MEKTTKETSSSSAVVLLSGGLDSATSLAAAMNEGFDCHALTFDYGQNHRCELESARNVAEFFGLGTRHRIVTLDKNLFLGSSLTGTGEIPINRGMSEMCEGIPSTYVPARNTVFLALALAYAEQIGAFDIVIGVNAVDYSGYPDCRPEFISAFEHLANLATKAGVSGKQFHIHTPLLTLKKTEIIKLGLSLGVDYSLTWSCYNPKSGIHPCGKCDSCQIRQKAFEELGIKDPLLNG
jgi:7-cyano-7-deazaguanine synthase